MIISLSIFLMILKLSLSTKKVLLAQYEPHVNCSLDQTYFQGVDYEFFLQYIHKLFIQKLHDKVQIRDVVKELNMTEDEIVYICEDFYVMLGRILSNETDILCSIGGITINKERIEIGYKFTTSYYNTGISLLIKAESHSWTFVKFFTTDFLVSWLCICIVTLSIMIWWLDGKYLSLLEYIWHSTTHLFINGSFSHRQSISKLLDYCQLICCIIFTLIFTSMIVQFYAYKYDLNLITSTEKAEGKIVGTFPGYQVYADYLLAYPVYQDFIDPHDVLELMDKTHVDAIVLDDTFLQICQAEYYDLYVVAQNFMPLGFGIMFPPITSDEVVHKYSEAILKVVQNYPMNQRLSEYINKHYRKFDKEKDLVNRNAYTIKDFYEIWLVYSVGLAISLFIRLINFFGNILSRKSIKIMPFKSKLDFDIEMRNMHYYEKMTSSGYSTTKSPLLPRKLILSNKAPSFIEFLEGAQLIKSKILERVNQRRRKRTHTIYAKKTLHDKSYHSRKNYLLKDYTLTIKYLNSQHKKDNFIELRERSNKRTTINMLMQIDDRLCRLTKEIEETKDHIALLILKKLVIIQGRLKKHGEFKDLIVKKHKDKKKWLIAPFRLDQIGIIP